MRFAMFAFALTLAPSVPAEAQPPNKPLQAGSGAHSTPDTQHIVGTWKMRSGGPSLTLLPNSSFLTGEGEGGVGRGTYSLSGDLLVLTYHTEGGEDTILYNRVVMQGRTMLLFQTEQRYGNQVWKYANDPTNLSTKPRKIVMTDPGGRKQTVDGGPTVYLR
jgi:hypothetical protein